MIRSMMAIAAGYFSIAILNSLTHLIISIYSKTELTLAGIAMLPSDEWVIAITALQPVFALFGGLLATTLAKDNKHLVLLGFILLMVTVAIVDYSVLSEREPLWYLIVAPILKITGVTAGYFIQINQQQSPITQ